MEERRVWSNSTTSYSWTSSGSVTASTTSLGVIYTSAQDPPDMGVVAWTPVPEPEPDDDNVSADRAA